MPVSVTSSMLVSTVMAMTSGAATPRRAASLAAASFAAFIIAAPPAACTLTIQTPRRVAAATAPATVFGMSWNFRSRNTRSPRATRVSTNAGPRLVNRRLPILKPPTMPRRRSARRDGVFDRVHVERDEQFFHVLTFAVSAWRPRHDRAHQIDDARDAVTL